MFVGAKVRRKIETSKFSSSESREKFTFTMLSRAHTTLPLDARGCQRDRSVADNL